MSDTSVPILTASIAAVITLVGLVVSKEQKTSEFRQAWIDGLRNDLAIFLSRINAAYDAAAADFKDKPELWKAVQKDMTEMTEASSRIRLRLNRSEKPSEAILATLKLIESSFNPTDGDKPQRVDDLQHKLVLQAEIVLKQEWTRVKKGEPFFRFTKWASLTVVVLSILVFAYKSLPLLQHLAKSCKVPG
jgi:hypothetical protein